jgi:hypothetical protein
MPLASADIERIESKLDLIINHLGLELMDEAIKRCWK